MAKFSSLNRIICDLVEDFGLVSFETLCVEVSHSFTFYTFESSKLTGVD